MSIEHTVANIRKHNRRLDEYIDKRDRFKEILAEVQNFIQPGDNGAEGPLAVMAEIDERILNIEVFFDELGYLNSYDETEIDEYRLQRIERDIGDGEIVTLSGVPMKYRDQFVRLLDRLSAEYDHDNLPRPEEDIRNDIGREFSALQDSYLFSDDFSKYLPAGRVKTSAKNEETREILNDLWEEYYDAAVELINHF